MAAPSKKQLAAKIVDLLARKGDISQRGRLVAHVINELKLTSSSTIREPMIGALLFLEREGTVIIERRGNIMDGVTLVKQPKEEKVVVKPTRTTARSSRTAGTASTTTTVRKSRAAVKDASAPATPEMVTGTAIISNTPATPDSPEEKVATPAAMPAKKVTPTKVTPVPSPPTVKLTVEPAPEKEEVPATADNAAAPAPTESKATDEVASEAKPGLNPKQLLTQILERAEGLQGELTAAQEALTAEQEAHAATTQQRNTAVTAKGEAERKLGAIQGELARLTEQLENERAANSTLQTENTRLRGEVETALEMAEQAQATAEALSDRDDLTEIAARVEGLLRK